MNAKEIMERYHDITTEWGRGRVREGGRVDLPCYNCAVRQGCNSIEIQDFGWDVETSLRTTNKQEVHTCLKIPNKIKDRFGDIPKLSIELHPRSRGKDVRRTQRRIWHSVLEVMSVSKFVHWLHILLN